MSYMEERIEALESCLTELLRLYDWRKELGKEEEFLKSPNCTEILPVENDTRHATLCYNLLRYGRAKLAAWEVARSLIGSPAESKEDV